MSDEKVCSVDCWATVALWEHFLIASVLTAVVAAGCDDPGYRVSHLLELELHLSPVISPMCSMVEVSGNNAKRCWLRWSCQMWWDVKQRREAGSLCWWGTKSLMRIVDCSECAWPVRWNDEKCVRWEEERKREVKLVTVAGWDWYETKRQSRASCSQGLPSSAVATERSGLPRGWRYCDMESKTKSDARVLCCVVLYSDKEVIPKKG